MNGTNYFTVNFNSLTSLSNVVQCRFSFAHISAHRRTLSGPLLSITNSDRIAKHPPQQLSHYALTPTLLPTIIGSVDPNQQTYVKTIRPNQPTIVRTNLPNIGPHLPPDRPFGHSFVASFHAHKPSLPQGYHRQDSQAANEEADEEANDPHL